MSTPVLITYSNDGYYDFALNLLKNLEDKYVTHKIHFYCLDSIIYNKLIALNLPLNLTIERFQTPEPLSDKFCAYNSGNYNKITHTKVSVLRAALKRYSYIHFIDCDVVCVKEPKPEYYDAYKDYDIIFQYDAGFYSADKPHSETLNHIWACTGNTTFRNTPATQKIIDIIEEYQWKYPNKNDQECLYQYFVNNNIKTLDDFHDARLFTYPYQEYTNGYWLKHDIGDLSRTYFFHANHVQGKESKINLLKKANEWYL